MQTISVHHDCWHHDVCVCLCVYARVLVLAFLFPSCGGLILVSPYTSVKDMVRTHAGIVTSWLTAELTNMFPSEELITRVKCPTLIVHGAKDLVFWCWWVSKRSGSLNLFSDSGENREEKKRVFV